MLSSKFPWYVEIYCELLGFFALDADEQRQLIPNQSEPIYASFGEGDGYFSSPLQVLSRNFYEVVGRIVCHDDDPHYEFIPLDLHDQLFDVVMKIDSHDRQHLEGIYDLSSLDKELWCELRVASRRIWDKLDEEHRLPLDDWRQYYG